MEKTIKKLKEEGRRLGVSPYELVPHLAAPGALEANGWNHPSFDSIRKRLEERDEYLTTPLEVEEGVLQCERCSSRRVFSWSKQTRAADEPMTTFAHCVVCGKKWRYSG